MAKRKRLTVRKLAKSAEAIESGVTMHYYLQVYRTTGDLHEFEITQRDYERIASMDEGGFINADVISPGHSRKWVAVDLRLVPLVRLLFDGGEPQGGEREYSHHVNIFTYAVKDSIGIEMENQDVHELGIDIDLRSNEAEGGGFLINFEDVDGEAVLFHRGQVDMIVGQFLGEEADAPGAGSAYSITGGPETVN